MLMAIKMGESQSCVLKTCDLRCNLAFDFIPPDVSEKGASDKFTTRAGKPASFINESRQRLAPQDSSLFYQRQMQANIQFRVLSSQRDSFLECISHHKQRGACYNSILKRAQDTSVDGRREPQVIRVDNQLFQGAKIVPLEFRVAFSSET
jgi:hypothetical protein